MVHAMKYNGWSAETAVDEAVEWFELDYDGGVPGEQSSLQFYYGANPGPIYGEGDAVVLDQTRGFSYIVQGMLEDNVPGKIVNSNVPVGQQWPTGGSHQPFVLWLINVLFSHTANARF